MTYQNPQTTPPRQNANMLLDLIRSGRLAWRLLLDPRVRMLAKLTIPVLAGLYVLSPVDLLPDFIPVLGQLDDVAIIALALRLFIQMAPPPIVAEHLADLAGYPPAGQPPTADKDVIDGDYHVIR